MMRSSALLCLAVLGFGVPAPAVAQSRPPARRPVPVRPQDEGVRLRGYADIGLRTFTASKSFEAVLGSSTGPVLGAGVQTLVGRHLFVDVGFSRFERTGERVFVFEDTVFPLGIDTTVTVVPIEASAGWRFVKPRRTVTPYVAGGISWHRYRETSEFAAAGDDVQVTTTGFQALGGAEWRLARLVGVAGEAEWMRVPNAFGNVPTSAATAFDEDDLGGAVFRIKVVIGR